MLCFLKNYEELIYMNSWGLVKNVIELLKNESGINVQSQWATHGNFFLNALSPL